MRRDPKSFPSRGRASQIGACVPPPREPRPPFPEGTRRLPTAASDATPNSELGLQGGSDDKRRRGLRNLKQKRPRIHRSVTLSAQTAFTALTPCERLDATLSPVSFTGGETNVCQHLQQDPQSAQP